MDISIDIIEYNDSKTKPRVYDYNYYDKVDTMPQWYPFCSIPFLKVYSSRYVKDWLRGKQLKKMLKGRHYDIIQCHYILGLYAGADYLKSHCDKLYFTFWGGELKYCRYLGSNNTFKNGIKQILYKDVDAIINGGVGAAVSCEKEGRIPKVYYGVFGSVPLEEIYKCIQEKNRNQCKSYWKMPQEKLSVQLGYSGKTIHQYLEIIDELKTHEELKAKLHLVAPMTRGASHDYIQKVDLALNESGYSYTVIDRHLTDKEMAIYRCSIDVVLQLAINDGYSRSIVEAISAGSVLIYGDWLKYDKSFKRDGFKGFAVDSIKTGVEKINFIIQNREECMDVCKENIKNGKNKNMWSECIKDWVNVYEGWASPIN